MGAGRNRRAVGRRRSLCESFVDHSTVHGDYHRTNTHHDGYVSGQHRSRSVSAPSSTIGARALPNVVGLDLQLAQDTLQAAGFYGLTSHDAKGLNRQQILDRSWTVVDQSPKPGAIVPLDQVVDLGSVRDEEYEG